MTQGEHAMRVLMTTDTIGGVWTYTMELAAALATRGVALEVIALGGPPSPDQWAQARAIAGVTVTPTALRLEWQDDPWADVAQAAALVGERCRAWRPHVVHLNNYGPALTPLGRPTVLVLHSCVATWWRAVKGAAAPAAWGRYRRLVQSAAQVADAVVAPTAAFARAFQREHGVARPVQVVPNGCDPTDAAPTPPERLVLAAGRMWDEAKNLRVLDAAAAEIGWPVLVAGSCGKRAAQHVYCSGRLAGGDVRALMARAPIFVAPARYEPFGLAVLEAAQRGAALVLADLPTFREVWGDAAAYVAPDDAEQWTHTVNALIADAALRTEFALAAGRRARRYSAAAMAERYLDLYHQVVHPMVAVA